MSDPHRDYQAQFLANISHEFRTPLAGMKVSIELLLENVRDLSTTEFTQLLNSLNLGVANLQRLIDNLLESSKIEADHFALRRQPMDVHTLLSASVRIIHPILARRQQWLRLSEPLALPDVNVDSVRIKQVLVNLLDNASKYSPMGTPITLQLDVEAGMLRVAVLDRGGGVPDSQRDAIFQRFVRLEHDLLAEHGAGLGLSVARSIIERHGGRIGVESHIGGGSVFWFTLPLAVVVEETA